MAAVDLKNPTTWNMYAYANDDPVSLNDPHGLLGCVVWGWLDCDALNTLWDLWAGPGQSQTNGPGALYTCVFLVTGCAANLQALSAAQDIANRVAATQDTKAEACTFTMMIDNQCGNASDIVAAAATPLSRLLG
jgi:hypothetical protein